MDENKNKKCFIVTPIGEDKSDIRRHADGVIESVVRPTLMELGYQQENIIAAHHISSPGSINNQVIDHILNDDLVIANLTGLNPNVMYELAVRHATMKPIVQICDKTTKLPFDIIEQRTILYTNDIHGALELKRALKDSVLATDKSDNSDNPIYKVIKTTKFLQEISIDKTDKYFEKYLVERFNTLEEKLNSITNNPKLNNIVSKMIYSSYYLQIKINNGPFGSDNINLVIDLIMANVKNFYPYVNVIEMRANNLNGSNEIVSLSIDTVCNKVDLDEFMLRNLLDVYSGNTFQVLNIVKSKG